MFNSRRPRIFASCVLACLLAPAASLDASTPSPEPEDGAVLMKDMTVEAENRIRIEFERPALDLDLNAREVPGLDRVNALEVLDRNRFDLVAPLVARSARERTPYLPRPWLTELSAGPVAVFRPSLDGVSRWALTIANSQGRTVARFEGSGNPPSEIGWDGRAEDGRPSLPGLVYSYALEAYDRAGNKRSFPGDGFELPAYRSESSDSLFLLIPGSELAEGPSLILEAATRLNQIAGARTPIRVRAIDRTFEAARALGERSGGELKPHLLGDPARVQILFDVQPDAPAKGALVIAAPR